MLKSFLNISVKLKQICIFQHKYHGQADSTENREAFWAARVCDRQPADPEELSSSGSLADKARGKGALVEPAL